MESQEGRESLSREWIDMGLLLHWTSKLSKQLQFSTDNVDVCHQAWTTLPCIPYLVKQCQVKALELFRVEFHGQRRSLSCETLQLLDEVPALGQRYTSPPPTHLDAGLWWKLLTNRGNQAVILDFWLKRYNYSFDWVQFEWSYIQSLAWC